MNIAKTHVKNHGPMCSRATIVRGASKFSRPTDVRAEVVALFLLRLAIPDPLQPFDSLESGHRKGESDRPTLTNRDSATLESQHSTTLRREQDGPTIWAEAQTDALPSRSFGTFK